MIGLLSSRRDFMVLCASAVTSTAFGKTMGTKFDANSVKALVFDTFGTVVDWRGSIIQQGQEFGRAKNINVDWAKFAERWRAGYAPSLDKVRKGQMPWTKLDDLHRILLDQLLVEFGITGLSESDKDYLNRVWHRLKGWPDSVSGLTRLKKRFVIAPLSNGNVALLTNMAKYAGLPWDCILSAELAKHYKPDPEVYLSAADLLGLKPAEVMMVAAHAGDLRSAGKVGLRTGFVSRPLEHGLGSKLESYSPEEFDVVVSDFNELASKLGV